MIRLKKWLVKLTAGAVLISGVAMSGTGAWSEIFSGVANMTASAAEITIPVGTSTTTLTYDYLSDGTIEIMDCDTFATGDLEIPSKIDGAVVTSVGSYAFGWCESLMSITIPDSVTSIGYYAFGYCSSLTSITISSSVEEIKSETFWNCFNLSTITVDPENAHYSSIDGVLYDKVQETFLFYPVGRSDESYEFPDSVTAIGDYVFYNCGSLTTVVINDHIEKIGNYVFGECDNLSSVTIGNSVTSIGSYAFYGCASLTSITIPDSVTSIGDYAFYNCDSLTCITIPDGVTSIGDHAFGLCDSLTSVTIPDSVTSIGGGAFNGCYSLASVTIGNGVTNIGDKAFSFCSSLTSITIPGSATSIWDYAFGSCSSLTTITVEDSNSAYCSIDGILFDKNLETLICYPAGKTDTSYEILDSVTSVGSSAFYDCDALTSITIPDSVTNIGDYAFYGCDSLNSITIPDGVTSIGDYAFSEGSSLTSISIGSGVTSLGERIFPLELKEIVYNGTEEEWGNLLSDSMSHYFSEETSSRSVTITIYFNNVQSRTEEFRPDPKVYIAMSTTTFHPDTLTGLIYIGDAQTELPITTTTTEISAQTITTTTTTTKIANGTPTTNNPILPTGDLDGDGSITIQDAYNALMAYSKASTEPESDLTDEQKTAADVDGDGKITINDAYKILLYYANTAAGTGVTWEEILG